MKTLLVMCIALHSKRPSPIPDFATSFSIVGVMFSNAIRAGRLNVRYSVRDFIESLPRFEDMAGRVTHAGGNGDSVPREPRQSRQRGSGRVWYATVPASLLL